MNIKLRILYSLLIASFFLVCYRGFNVSLERDYAIIWADIEGYYLYLPAIFINNGFENLNVKTTGYFPVDSTNNRTFNKYTYGSSILQAPFFIATHYTLKQINPEKADGYDRIYHVMIRVSTFFYVLLGLIILYYSLLNWFPEYISAITVFSIFAGTNLYYYTTYTAGLSHPYSFFLLSLLLYLTTKLKSSKSYKVLLSYAFVLGLAVVVRPTNILFFLFTLLYGFNNRLSIKTMVELIVKNRKLIIFSIVGVLVFVIPQLMIWSYMKGETTVYSYGNEHFKYWASPKMHLVLFYVQNGLFIFSPALLFSLVGIIIGLIKNKFSTWPIFIILFILTYIYGSWTNWWFGGAFGHRCYVEWFVLMAIPFAYCIQLVFKIRYTLLRVPLLFVLLFFIYYSIQMAYAYGFPWEGAGWNWKAYWNIVEAYVLPKG
jgi:hypothetical protein